MVRPYSISFCVFSLLFLHGRRHWQTGNWGAWGIEQWQTPQSRGCRWCISEPHHWTHGSRLSPSWFPHKPPLSTGPSLGASTRRPCTRSGSAILASTSSRYKPATRSLRDHIIKLKLGQPQRESSATDHYYGREKERWVIDSGRAVHRLEI